jgi:hypothetical protein
MLANENAETLGSLFSITGFGSKGAATLGSSSVAGRIGVALGVTGIS